jgi:hypothetical protein
MHDRTERRPVALDEARRTRIPSPEVASGTHDPVALGQAIVAVLSDAQGPLPASALARAVRLRVPVGDPNFFAALRRLRANGLLRAEPPRPFRYSLAREPRPSDFGQKGRQTRGPTIREALLATIDLRQPVTRAELFQRVSAIRPDVRPSSIAAVFHELCARRAVLVVARGTPRLYMLNQRGRGVSATA